MTYDHHVSPAIMYDQAKLFERFIIGNQTVGALKRIVMGIAIHFQRRLHGFAAQPIGIRMLGTRGHSAFSEGIQLLT